MPGSKATHQQAQLQLQLFDLRREARIREARDWFNANCFIDSADDLAKIAPAGSKENTHLMMVIGYWDQAAALLNHGLLHEQLFFETTGEFYFVWDRIKPAVAPLREKYHMKHYLKNLEKTSQRYEKWVERQSPGVLAAWREFGKQMRAARTVPAAKTAGAR